MPYKDPAKNAACKAAYSKESRKDPAIRARDQNTWNRYRESKQSDPEFRRSRRSSQMKAQYGITLEQAEQYMITQWGRCAICTTHIEFGHEERKHKACVDHDHETGFVRGLLCSPCNVSLGGFKDDPEVLRAAAEYLEKRKSHENDQRRIPGTESSVARNEQ